MTGKLPIPGSTLKADPEKRLRSNPDKVRQFLDRGCRSSAESLKRTPTEDQRALREGAGRRPKPKPISPAIASVRSRLSGRPSALMT